jgi:hypothetical protein
MSDTIRTAPDGTETTPEAAPAEPIVASIPGSSPDNLVPVRLAHPLNQKDREYLGLPPDGKTEVGAVVKVSRNGAKALINAGLANVDPEDPEQVRQALAGASVGATSAAEAPSDGVVDVAPGADDTAVSVNVAEDSAAEGSATESKRRR